MHSHTKQCLKQQWVDIGLVSHRFHTLLLICSSHRGKVRPFLIVVSEKSFSHVYMSCPLFHLIKISICFATCCEFTREKQLSLILRENEINFLSLWHPLMFDYNLAKLGIFSLNDTLFRLFIELHSKLGADGHLKSLRVHPISCLICAYFHSAISPHTTLPATQS